MLVLTVSNTTCLEISHNGEKMTLFFEGKVKIGVNASKEFDVKRVKLDKVDKVETK
jgi:sRNA-binding carbon storage regulator CsrA